MSQPAPRLRRIALEAAGNRHDLVVPQNEALAGALAAVGVHLAATDRVLGPDGAAVDAATSAAELREGGLYAVAGPLHVSTSDRAEADALRRASAAPWALLGFGAAAAVLAAVVPEWRWVTVAVLALAAVATAVAAASRRRARGSLVAAAVGLGGAAAASAVLPAVGASPGLAIAVAAAAISVLAALLGFMAVSPRLQAAATPLVVISATVAVLALLSPALGWSPAQLLIMCAALATVGVRAAPSLLVGVDPGHHIDYGRFMSLRWTVRGRVPEFIESVDRDRVTGVVALAEARLDATVLMLSVVAALGIPAAIVPLTSGDLVQIIAGSAFVAWTVLGLLLTSRRTAARSLRTPPRIAVIAGLVMLVLLSAPHLTLSVSLLVAGGALLAGLVAAAAILPLARGDRSLGWSRTGDIVDSIAVALVLPAGVLAAGTLNLLQGVLAA